MGLFNCFKRYNKIERNIIDKYTILIARNGVSKTDARKKAEELLKLAILKSKEEGAYYLPPNFGNMIFGDVETDDYCLKEAIVKTRETLDELRKGDDITDADIREWWNLYDVERSALMQYDEAIGLAVMLNALEESHSVTKEQSLEEATNRLKQLRPRYGDPRDTTHGQGDDRPLPHELKLRIDRYLDENGICESQKNKEEIETYSTFNAYIRAAIRSGKL